MPAPAFSHVAGFKSWSWYKSVCFHGIFVSSIPCPFYFLFAFYLLLLFLLIIMCTFVFFAYWKFLNLLNVCDMGLLSCMPLEKNYIDFLRMWNYIYTQNWSFLHFKESKCNGCSLGRRLFLTHLDLGVCACRRGFTEDLPQGESSQPVRALLGHRLQRR